MMSVFMLLPHLLLVALPTYRPAQLEQGFFGSGVLTFHVFDVVQQLDFLVRLTGAVPLIPLTLLFVPPHLPTRFRGVRHWPIHLLPHGQ
jgi:hypothetical protein